jgi:serine/threonine-protein kinase RsbW
LLGRLRNVITSGAGGIHGSFLASGLRVPDILSFMFMAEPVQFEIAIPSNTARGHEVQERILNLLQEREFSAKDLFGVKLALEEAIVNAIKHGNRMDPSKSVRVRCELDDERVQILVEDEGLGFDPSDVPDPTEVENLEKPSGRGLMLMRAFMTTVEYNARGNRVLLEKRRSVEPAE